MSSVASIEVFSTLDGVGLVSTWVVFRGSGFNSFSCESIYGAGVASIGVSFTLDDDDV